MDFDGFKSIDIFNKYSLDIGGDPKKLNALKSCLKFVDVGNENNKLYHGVLKDYMATYPSLMGSALRILHDETELEITKYDSDTIPEYLSEIITHLDGFVEPHIYELRNYEILYRVATIVCTSLVVFSMASSIQNYKTLPDGAFLTIPITLLIGTYTNFRAIKALRDHNDFKSAYNEKPESL